MAITVKDTVNDYIADLLVILRQFETFSGTPYYDQAPVNNSTGEYQNATIGDGVNIDWSNSTNLRLVLAQLGLVDSSNASVVYSAGAGLF